LGKKRGANALASLHANRRRQRTDQPAHALLNTKQLEELRSSLKQQPEDKGIWTGPKVADWIAKKTGREKVWPQRGWDYQDLRNWHIVTENFTNE